MAKCRPIAYTRGCAPESPQICMFRVRNEDPGLFRGIDALTPRDNDAHLHD